MPHNLAGFSGGGKIVMPGLGSIDAVEANHRGTLKGLSGRIGVLEGNQVRADIEEAAERAGLNFIVNSVHGEDGATVQVFAGDPRETYAEAVARAQQVYACDVVYGEDVGVFNAFPRDNWFLLSLSSMDVWSSREASRAIVRPGGTIVVINHCTEGAGEHGLHTKGMKHYVMRDEHGTFRQILADRDLIVLSPNLHPGIVKDYYRKPVALCPTWPDVRTLLERKHGARATVSVFPCGTLQMDRAVLESTR
jgi:nickel-dependent lactate racemase